MRAQVNPNGELLIQINLTCVFDYIGRQEPPPITHPQFYYGFAGIGLAFQFVFLVIASDPVRFWPLVIPSVLEKLGYVIPVAALYFRGRISISDTASSVPDAVLCLLFVAAWFQVRVRNGRRIPWPPANVRIP